MGKPSIYPDVCVLCRPFDDQKMMRIRLETDGYHLIMQAIQNGVYKMVYSPVHDAEVSAIQDVIERVELLEIIHQYGDKCGGDVQIIRKRADEFLANGMGIADAAHVAFAEANADYFLSCDDRLIKQCYRQGVDIVVMMPVEFCIQEKLK